MKKKVNSSFKITHIFSDNEIPLHCFYSRVQKFINIFLEVKLGFYFTKYCLKVDVGIKIYN